ncbi:EAL domain-containing protein [Anaerobacillus isosaccharinicus]|uniref:EAL domain-containing protein n=1 Tax=Anaerobacillus isosaccharinicus TaxID=1532552 RepID=A0A1S2MD77_9BACI|nr:EAL domain-containing protein [Anaerobacillus isosaccharinicus]MBA5586690.1 EAL domain-containing protein [Anaerobacillus isosaccharinicus]QOY35081.1 EAL domain-containing protein [Anaerobacillus isosaccharinicus]
MEFKRDLTEVKELFSMMAKLFDMVFLMKLRHDGFFEYIQFSDRAKDLANLPDDAIGRCLQEIYYEGVASYLHDKYTTAIKNKQTLTFVGEMNLRNMDSIRMAESTLIPIVINEEQYVIAFTKDVTELENKKNEVFEQKERFFSLFTYNNDPIITTDENGSIQMVNEAFTSKFTITETGVLNKVIHELYPTLAVFEEKPKMRPVEEEVVLETSFGTMIALVKRIPIIVKDSNLGFYFIINDITSQREIIVTNKAMEDRYKKLIEISPQIIFLVRERKIVYANQVCLKVLKATLGEVIGKDISSYIKEEIGSFVKDGDIATMTTKNGEVLYITQKKSVVFFNEEKLVLYSITDITNQIAIERELDFREQYDSLTGLYNRKSLDQLIQLQISSNDHFCFVLFNIDKFKLVNDLVGTTNADTLLVEFSERLKKLSDKNFIARINGDEFVVLVPQEQSLNMFLVELQKELSHPFETEKGPIHITTSTAISKFPEHGANTEQLYLSATKAMTLAKINGARQVLYFEEEMQEVFSRKYKIENELKLSLKENHFYVAYQPKIHLKGKPIELEALIRWQHPVLGMVSPAEFIPIAEESGLIIEIGKFVIDQVCRDLQQLHKTYPHLRIAINLSPKQFLDTELELSILAVIKKYRLDPKFIEFEITETAIMIDPNKAISILNSLKNNGITIAIDDFGTSFSSFNYLKKLPVDTIKIDRSFINGIGENEKDSSLVEGLIDLAHKMNLMITAEGVETKEQLEFLKEKKCDIVQGFYFSRPEKIENIILTLDQLNVHI